MKRLTQILFIAMCALAISAFPLAAAQHGDSDHSGHDHSEDVHGQWKQADRFISVRSQIVASQFKSKPPGTHRLRRAGRPARQLTSEPSHTLPFPPVSAE